MRLHFSNSTRPKKAAKVFADLMGKPLSLCQRAVARSSGYRDWHELEDSYSLERASESDEFLSRESFVERQIALASRLSLELSTSGGETQYALAVSHLTGNRRPDLSEQLDIRIGLFRSRELPAVLRQNKGAIGKLKTPSRNGELVILRQFGRPTRVITHKTADASVADFEYVTPRKPAPLFIPMRLYIAYGAWTERDGAIVLFSRDYLPLWRIREAHRAERMEPWTRIQFVDQRWFWNDVSTPWSDSTRYRIELDRLHKFGVLGLPLLVEVLPIVVRRDDVRSFKDAVTVLKNDRKSDEAA